MPSVYEHAGGEAALHRLEQTFYDSVLREVHRWNWAGDD
jgi:hemoglobin